VLPRTGIEKSRKNDGGNTEGLQDWRSDQALEGLEMSWPSLVARSDEVTELCVIGPMTRRFFPDGLEIGAIANARTTRSPKL
jgi:hypothetical protein